MSASSPRRHRWWRVPLVALLLLVVVPLGLFTLNGTVLATGEQALVGIYADIRPAPPGETVTVVSYNVAKGFAHKSGLSFDTKENVQARMKRMADAVRGENPDLVFLSEVMTEATPCPVNQVQEFARGVGLNHWAFGENYNFGLPFCRVVGGNAILSRTPLLPAANISLAGRKPFWETKNSRRALFATTELHGRAVLLVSLHNDSFSRANNAVQVRELLAFVADQPCVLAGDFNAEPAWESMTLLKESGRFVGAFDGPPTFPADKPEKRIDYVFAPRDWEHLGTRVIDEPTASDHRPVVARFRVK
jgi:endonuclease/exonuclease/phosphatase family metal-dependent hydrolase